MSSSNNPQDFSKFKEKSLYEGVYGLQLPVDNDRLNETMCELRELEAIRANTERVTTINSSCIFLLLLGFHFYTGYLSFTSTF